MTTPTPLPVLGIEADLLRALDETGAGVLSAPTGSGKTTQVPQMLLRDLDGAAAVDAATLGAAASGAATSGSGGQILVLQPRRLAARVVAARVAAETGTELGTRVGYQTRHERHAGADTRILFLTEGLFLRRLLREPTLDGVAAVVVDEFHERSVAVDLALGLCRRLRAGPRPDLRLVVMSATLDAQSVAGWLGCPALHAEGRVFPVDIEYAPGDSEAPIWQRAAAALRRWLDGAGKSDDGEGDALVFMPGAFEISRTIEACRGVLKASDGDVEVLPLHGSLPPAAQDRAVGPSSRRKVIVSTNVAETSITIDGVRCVIDGGLARVQRYDPDRAVNALLVERISQASADQRAGRAGRTAPGICLRLWPRHDVRPVRDAPAVERVDLTEAVLQLKALGIDDAAAFDWLDPPPATRLAAGTELLSDLGATDASGALTRVGRALVDLPAHPRLARMLWEASRRGVADRAAVWAALIAERDICTRPLAARYRTPPDTGWPSDLIVRERALETARRARFDPRRCAEAGLNPAACREVDRAAQQYARILADVATAPDASGSARTRRGRRRAAPAAGGSAAGVPADAATGDGLDAQLARCVLVGYADHVALRRGTDGRECEMAGRRRVVLDRDSAVGEASVFVAVEAREVEAPRREGGGVHTVASLATAIEPAWLEELFPERVVDHAALEWDDGEKAVYEVAGRRFGPLVLNARRRRADDGDAAAALIIERLRDGRLRFERWDDAVETWLARSRCVAAWFPERGLLAYDEDDLAVIAAELVGTASRWGAVRRAPVLDAVRHALSWDEQRFVEEMAPERIKLRHGFGMKITYTAGEPPRGRARIQDFYGMTQTPRVAGGRIPVLLEILAPNNRPAQVTDDLPGFWERTYPELRRSLSRRYPRHEWR